MEKCSTCGELSPVEPEPLYGQRFTLPSHILHCAKCGDSRINLTSPADRRLSL